MDAYNKRVIDLTINELELIIFNQVNDIVKSNPTQIKDEEYVTRKRACEILHCSLPTLHNHMNSANLEYIKIGRKTLILSSSIDDFINRSKIQR